MTKTAALIRLKEIFSLFSENLMNTINFQFRAPDSIRFHELEKALLASKSMLEKNDKEIVFKNLLKEIKTIETLPDIVFPMSIVYGIAHFEVLLADMTKLLSLYFYKSMSTKDKYLTYEEILKLGEFKNIQEYIVEQEVNSFSFKSINQRVTYLEKRFGLKFTYEKQNGIRKNWNCIELNDLIEIHSTRNIIVHNNSVVNKFYLSENLNSEHKIGDKKLIGSEYSIHALFVLFRVSGAIYSVIKKKIENKK